MAEAPPQAAEGRAWWLQLQQARRQQGCTTAADAKPAALASPPKQQQTRAERRAALLRDAQALQRRLEPARPASAPIATALTATSTATSGSEAAPAAPPPTRRPSSAAQPVSRRSSAQRDAGADAAQAARLLEGGLVGRSMAASAAWHAERQRLSQREHAEWGLLHGGRGAGAPGQLPALAEEGDSEEAGGQAPAAGAAPAHDAAAEAAALVAAFVEDAEVRRYLTQALADCSTGASGSGSRRKPSDPLLRAWGVTRAPPAVPVRGYEAPPCRAACRIVTAQEMRECAC